MTQEEIKKLRNNLSKIDDLEGRKNNIEFQNKNLLKIIYNDYNPGTIAIPFPTDTEIIVIRDTSALKALIREVVDENKRIIKSISTEIEKL